MCIRDRSGDDPEILTYLLDDLTAFGRFLEILFYDYLRTSAAMLCTIQLPFVEPAWGTHNAPRPLAVLGKNPWRGVEGDRMGKGNKGRVRRERRRRKEWEAREGKDKYAVDTSRIWNAGYAPVYTATSVWQLVAAAASLTPVYDDGSVSQLNERTNVLEWVLLSAVIVCTCNVRNNFDKFIPVVIEQ